MSKIVVKFDEQKSELLKNVSQSKPKKRGFWRKILAVFGVLFLLTIVIGAIGTYFYWQNLQKSPAYSLALLIDAAKRDDQKTVAEFLDTDAVIDSFMPQVIEKATDRYGRGLAPDILTKATSLIAPMIPQVKDVAKKQIPILIREKAEAAPNVSPWAMAIGINQVLTVKESGDTAEITGNLKGRDINLTMKRNGARWKLIGLKDDVLADKVSEKVGQEIIAALKQGQDKAGKVLGINGLQDLLNKAKDILK